MEAVAAYHVHQDGSAGGCYDIAVADCVLEMIKDGCPSWEQAMKSSPADADSPLQLQGSPVEFAEQRVQLGIMLDTRFDGRAHLHHILSLEGLLECMC